MTDLQRVPMAHVGEFARGRRFTKTDMTHSGIPSIHYGEIYTTYGISAIRTVSFVREDLRSQLRFAKPGDVVIAAVGETVEDVGRGVAWLGDTDVAIHDDCFLFRSTELDPRYVAYFLRTQSLIREKDKYVARAKVKRISGENLGRLLIPVPEIEQQRRIVATLDRYNSHIAELSDALTGELQARQQQYEHYSNRLFDSDGE